MLRRATIGALARLAQLHYDVDVDLRRPRVQFLMVHEVHADEERGFRRHIEHLARYHTFVSYSEAVDRILTGRIDVPYLAFTFDDGFASSRWAGIILREYEARACFFLCPSIIGETDPGRVAWFYRHRLREADPHEFLGWDGVEALVVQGHEVGGHSLTHPDFAALTRAELEDEIGGCRDELQKRLGEIRHFAWPFGQFSQITRAGFELVFAQGFRSCASGERGCHVTAVLPREKLCVRRDQISAPWNWRHVEFFLSRNSRRGSGETNVLPASVR